MLKKIGIGLLLAFTMLISTFNVGTRTNVYATPPCTTLSECRELQRETRDNIADYMEQEDELGDEIAQIQAEISDLRNDISELENRISVLEAEIEVVELEISDLIADIELNLDILADTEDRIDVLLDEVAERMRVAQHVNNTNSFLTALSEAESLTGLIRVTRTFNRIATSDAERMEELTELVDVQENLLVELDEQIIVLEERRAERADHRAELGVEQATLEDTQYELMVRETEMQDRLYAINLSRIDEEEVLAAIEAAEEILARTPPPPVTTPTNNSNSSSSSSSSSNGSSSSSSGTPQTPNESGLAHPIPGARVSSEFGPRWGGWHAGIDLVVLGNTSAPILAAASGTVTISEWHNSMGYYVVISHNINGQRVDTLYGHLRYRAPVSVGDVVSQGDRIGTKGNTGHSFGAHLHFEVHPGGFSWGTHRGVDPRLWINF